MDNEIQLIFASIFLLMGSVICLIAAVGVLRLPDVFMRMHAATKAGVAGCGLVLIGVACVDGSLATAVKVTLAILFLVLTTPIAGHLLSRAAYMSGAPFWKGTIVDQLRGVLPRKQIGKTRNTLPKVTPRRKPDSQASS